MLKLSKHFVNNWRKRMGGTPDPTDVNNIITRAVRVQKGKRAVTRFSYIKTLTIYWEADLNIIITVDHFTGTIVSIYSKKNMPVNGKLKVGEAYSG